MPGFHIQTWDNAIFFGNDPELALVTGSISIIFKES